VKLTRTPTAGGATLAVDWSKAAGTASHWNVATTIQSKADALGTTVRWRAESARLASRFDAPGDAAGETRSVVTGEAGPREIQIVTNATGKPERLNVSQPVTLDWQLFDVVQRLPREAGTVGPFTIVDSVGGVRGGQRLSYGDSVKVDVAGSIRRLHRYDLVGPGTVPTTYWVDDRTGRLVAVVSGLEAHVLGLLPPGGGRERPAKAGRKGAAEAPQY
jgi:hypothetical protein